MNLLLIAKKYAVGNFHTLEKLNIQLLLLLLEKKYAKRRIFAFSPWNWRLRIIHSLQEFCKIIAFERFLWISFKVHKLLQKSLKDKYSLEGSCEQIDSFRDPSSFQTFFPRPLPGPYIESSFSKDHGENPYFCKDLESSFKYDAWSLKLLQGSWKILARISFP